MKILGMTFFEADAVSSLAQARTVAATEKKPILIDLYNPF
jgi:hypothetical protein